MRRETGSRSTIVQHKISVRLPANGDLFVIDEALRDFPAAVDVVAGELRVELLTKRMMLIPSAMLSGDNSADVARDELSKMGIVPTAREQMVRLVRGDVAALVMVPAVVIEQIESRYGEDRVTYDVPLLRDGVVESEHMLLDICSGVMTIKLFRRDAMQSEVADRVRFADVYETLTDASALYYIQRVCLAMDVRSTTPLYIYRCSGSMRRQLQRNFKKIMICG